MKSTRYMSICLSALNGFKSCCPHEQTIVNLDFFEIYSGFLFLTGLELRAKFFSDFDRI